MSNPARKFYSGSVAGTKAVVTDKPIDIHNISVLNTTAAVAYLQLFFKATADVTVGTTVPDLSYGIPASGGGIIPLPQGFYPPGPGLVVAGTTTRTGSTGAQIDTNVIYN